VESEISEAVRAILRHVGDDPDREGLAETPRRVADAYLELTSGHDQDPGEHLRVTFTEDCDEMVVVSGIDFVSLCEHHLLPFIGTVAVGYIPEGKVVGLSKLARAVDILARRLQVQERLTRQIAETLVEHVAPKGVGVLVEANHSCMGIRGVRKPRALTTTSTLLGVFRTDAATRNEFLTLTRGNDGGR